MSAGEVFLFAVVLVLMVALGARIDDAMRRLSERISMMEDELDE